MKECDACTRSSDNKHFNCPPHMADGRHFTDYRPRCLINLATTTVENNTMNSYEFRQYLVHNADNIMRQNKIAVYQENLCGPCMDPYDIGTMLPEQTIVECNANTCKTFTNDPNGLGVGRQYVTSDNKQAMDHRTGFLQGKQKEQEWMKQKLNCCTSGIDDLQYFPYDNVVDADFGRATLPSGAKPMSGGDKL